MIVVTLLLFISFILHIGTFWMIWKLKKRDTQANTTTPREITELLDLYLEEIKEENRLLKNDMQHFKSESNSSNHFQSQEPSKNNITHLNIQETNNEYQEVPFYYEESEDYVEASNEAKILSLYNQGFKPLDIARKLNVGKTEVQLTLKFHHEK